MTDTFSLPKKRQGPTLNDDGGCAAYGYYYITLVLLKDACEDNITKNGESTVSYSKT
jgi:hypothetical protein